MPYRGDSRIAELLMDRGRIAADAAQRSGAAWGNAVQHIGEIGRSTLAGLLQYQQDAPRREMEALQIAQVKRDMATQDRAAQDASTLQSAMSSRLDPSQIESQLAELGQGHLIPAFKKSWMDSETAKLTLRTKRTEAEAAEADYFGALAAGVKAFNYDPGAVRTAFQKAKDDGYDDADGILQQLEQNPQAIQNLVDSLIQKSPAQRKLLGEEADRALRTKQEDRAILTSQQAQADREADNKRADATAAEAARHHRVMEGRPTGQQAPVSIIGPDGKPVYVHPSQALGQTPATVREQPTEDERRSGGYYTQMNGAIATMDALEDKLTAKELYQIQTMPQEGLIGMANRGELSENAKRYFQAFEEFTEARLRSVSGATITPNEEARDRRIYAKQYGETPKIAEQRKASRLRALGSLKTRAGRALPKDGGDGEGWMDVGGGFSIREKP